MSILLVGPKSNYFTWITFCNLYPSFLDPDSDLKKDLVWVKPACNGFLEIVDGLIVDVDGVAVVQRVGRGLLPVYQIY